MRSSSCTARRLCRPAAAAPPLHPASAARPAPDFAAVRMASNIAERVLPGLRRCRGHRRRPALRLVPQPVSRRGAGGTGGLLCRVASRIPAVVSDVVLLRHLHQRSRFLHYLSCPPSHSRPLIPPHCQVPPRLPHTPAAPALPHRAPLGVPAVQPPCPAGPKN